MKLLDTLKADKRYSELMELNSRIDAAHDLDHHIRVAKYCQKIGQEENADLEILEAAALLHDIARGLENSGQVSEHVKAGAEAAEEILKQINFSPDKIPAVVYAISHHMRRPGEIADSIEAKVLQDADHLDTYGLIYVARSILWGLQSEKYRRPLFIDEHIENFDLEKDKNLSTIHYLMHRLRNPELHPQSLHTQAARRMAEHKIKYMQEFVDNFICEWRGET